jgi:hypothetical protein
VATLWVIRHRYGKALLSRVARDPKPESQRGSWLPLWFRNQRVVEAPVAGGKTAGGPSSFRLDPDEALSQRLIPESVQGFSDLNHNIL